MVFTHKATGTSSRRKAAVTLTVLVLISIVCYAIYQLSNHWRIKPLIKYVVEVPLSNIRACICAPQREVEFHRDDGLRIRGSLYGQISDRGGPTVLIVHGNTPLGRKLPLYEVLADKLRQQGYLVLTIDRAGHGESDDPFALGTVEALNADEDVYAAVDYLRSLQIEELRDTYSIHVIGHSGGATPALSAGIEHPDIKTITAIGPARRVSEILSLPSGQDYYWQRMQQSWQQVYGHGLPAWYTKELWLELVRGNDMVKHIDYFSTVNHKPLLLLDGGRESEDDKLFLSNYYDQITQPKRYITIPRSDHYSNTTAFLRLSSLNLYDKDVVDHTVAEIDRWIATAREVK